MEHLAKWKGEWPRIARECELDYFWVQRFAQNRTNDPGILKVEKLMEWFNDPRNLPKK